MDENLRLRHRTLDLRRAPMQDALALRHRVVETIREVLDERDFPRDRDAVSHPLHARGGA